MACVQERDYEVKITGLKINGIKNPVGFSYENVLCSWRVEETTAKRQKNVKIEVSTNPEFSDLVYQIEGKELKSKETRIDPKLKPYTIYYWRVTVTTETGESSVSETAFFETGKMNEAWSAKWIGTTEQDSFHPIFRKSFSVGRAIKSARLYICGLGLYEAYMNGKKVGDDYLAPFLNDYIEGYQYQTYDITALLKEQNTCEILLGKGWYMGKFGLGGKENLFGKEMMVIAELRLLYQDGTIETIVTDEDWEYRGSDIKESGIYFGEIYDRLLWKGKENPWKLAVMKESPGKLKERYSLPLIVKETLSPVNIISTPAGETVLDFGQNHAGYMEFDADFPEGTTIKIECGEVLQNGCFYHGNYREAQSEFIYVADGRKERVRPHFTYFGYRYLKVSGWPRTLNQKDIISNVVYSDLDRIGFFETSDEKINRLYKNCLWGLKSNFIDLPTDCPQRNERLGWTGDAQVFAPTASYHMDTRAFYRKFLTDLRSEQKRANGAVPNYFPSIGDFGTASVWGDSATFIPSLLYKMYGNAEELKEYYPLMRDWVSYMYQIDEKNGGKRFFQNGFQFGDWLALDGQTEQSFKGSTDDDYIGTVYYYQSTHLTALAAEILGYEEDAAHYQKLAEEIKQAIFYEYFTPSGRLALDTQASYLIALKFGLYIDKEKLISQLMERLKKDSFKIRCGFVGAPLLCTTLCENGLEDVAYEFLFQEGFPSWLYCVNLGATTIWERWNSILPDGTISPTGMNSLNHYAYGSVVEFFYAYIAGIRPMVPGFEKAVIAPTPNARLRYCNCRYESVSGTYVSNWNINEDGKFTMHVEIPFGCEAEVVFPRCKGKREVLEAGSYDFSYMPDRDFRQIYDENTRMSQLADDKEALEILKEELPAAYGIIIRQDAEHLQLSFKELGGLFFMGFTPEKVEKAAKKIYALIR